MARVAQGPPALGDRPCSLRAPRLVPSPAASSLRCPHLSPAVAPMATGLPHGHAGDVTANTHVPPPALGSKRAPPHPPGVTAPQQPPSPPCRGTRCQPCATPVPITAVLMCPLLPEMRENCGRCYKEGPGKDGSASESRQLPRGIGNRLVMGWRRQRNRSWGGPGVQMGTPSPRVGKGDRAGSGPK